MICNHDFDYFREVIDYDYIVFSMNVIDYDYEFAIVIVIVPTIAITDYDYPMSVSQCQSPESSDVKMLEYGRNIARPIQRVVKN